MRACVPVLRLTHARLRLACPRIFPTTWVLVSVKEKKHKNRKRKREDPAAAPGAGEPEADGSEIPVGNKRHCAPKAEYVLCSEPGGAAPVKRMAIGKPTTIKPSPGRYVSVDYDMMVRWLSRMGCTNPACSPLHHLEPRTDQPIAGGSAQITCWCTSCGQPESFNLAGNTRKGRSHEARPYRTDLEASEMGIHILDGAQFRTLMSRALHQGRHMSIQPNKKVWAGVIIAILKNWGVRQRGPLPAGFELPT